MAGYCGRSKSINAVIAEQNGLFPAERAAKLLGVSPEAIEAVLSPVEWHHTGPRFAKTYYYNTTIDDDTMTKLREFSPAKIEENLYYADVKWQGWKGKRRRRKAIEFSCKNILVIERGNFYTFHTPAGIIRKAITSPGTIVKKINSESTAYTNLHNDSPPPFI